MSQPIVVLLDVSAIYVLFAKGRVRQLRRLPEEKGYMNNVDAEDVRG